MMLEGLILIGLHPSFTRWRACTSLKPREQVADAEAFSDIAYSLVMRIKAHSKDGLTASDLINSLIEGYGQGGTSSGREGERVSIGWREIGVAVSDIFKTCPGCHTMIGPMNTQLKQRKAVVRKGVKATETSRPEEVDDSVAKEKTDTDKNMATMFDILKKKRSVRLENLLLNRNSFAQTVENLFALSFLVKDGRAEVKVNQNGWHLVSPRNAPTASAVASKEVSFNHFIFRFDFNDWKLMTASVGVGEELMPNRNEANMPNDTQQDMMSEECEGPTTPIRKLS
uniref:Non-structural maintenance of chromosomes element 4 n=3 Tax=Rhizophora mucronata TaxID=61149 RepID=A0A2P2JAS8_RHIMU